MKILSLSYVKSLFFTSGFHQWIFACECTYITSCHTVVPCVHIQCSIGLSPSIHIRSSHWHPLQHESVPGASKVIFQVKHLIYLHFWWTDITLWAKSTLISLKVSPVYIRVTTDQLLLEQMSSFIAIKFDSNLLYFLV